MTDLTEVITKEVLEPMKREFIEKGFVVDELSNPKYDLPIVVTSKGVGNWIGRWLNIFDPIVAEIYDSDGLEGLQIDGWSIPNDWGDSFKFIL